MMSYHYRGTVHHKVEVHHNNISMMFVHQIISDLQSQKTDMEVEKTVLERRFSETTQQLRGDSFEDSLLWCLGWFVPFVLVLRPDISTLCLYLCLFLKRISVHCRENSRKTWKKRSGFASKRLFHAPLYNLNQLKCLYRKSRSHFNMD